MQRESSATLQRRFLDWNGEVEGGPSARPGFNPYFSVVVLDHLLGDGEPDACALLRDSRASIEYIKNFLMVFSLDAHAIVLDPE